MDVAAFLLALVPIIWLVVMLLCFKWPAWKAAIGSFVLSCVLAFAWWHLSAAQIATASLEGFLMALWPIVLVIIAAVFTYNLCVRTGAMDVIGSMITSISSDRRLLALLVAWCFGGFMEGMAGFGTAVAIPAGMLAGLGFEAVPAVLICPAGQRRAHALRLHWHPHGIRCRPGGPGLSALGNRSDGAAGAFLCDDAAVYCTGCWSCCR